MFLVGMGSIPTGSSGIRRVYGLQSGVKIDCLSQFHRGMVFMRIMTSRDANQSAWERGRK